MQKKHEILTAEIDEARRMPVRNLKKLIALKFTVKKPGTEA